MKLFSPECIKLHAVLAQDGKKVLLHSSGDEIIVALKDGGFGVSTLFADLKHSSEMLGRVVGYAELA